MINIENNLTFNILWPCSQNIVNKNIINNNSMVCKLVYNKFSMLFTGDIEEIAEERTDIKVCKIDVDENPEIARKYKVFSIPMLFVFKNGEVAARTVGAQSKEAILEML